jgi:uncharacterized protein (DUF2147 family)
MRKLLAVAALVLIGTSAQAAEHYSFQIGGRTVRIEVPNRCADISCISVNVPGVNLGNIGGSSDDVPPLPKLPGQANQPPAPAAGTTVTAPATTTAPAPVTTNVAPPGTGGLAPPPPPPPAPATITATAPVTTTTALPPASTPTILPGELMPVGVWATEKNEGKVRIVQCGQALCGYAVDERTNANGKQVLIDMKSTRENLWNGKINDVKNGGIYVSKMSLHGPDSLRVEGCAMGGMLCGGQTWVRTQ